MAVPLTSCMYMSNTRSVNAIKGECNDESSDASQTKAEGQAETQPRADRYTVVMLTGDEKQTIQDAAALAAMPTSVWIRSGTLKEARRLLAKMPKR